MRAARRLLLFAFITLTIGCAAPTASEPSVFLQTDQSEYVADAVPGTAPRTRYAFAVELRLTNNSLQSVPIGRCGLQSTKPMYSVVLTESAPGQESAYNPVWACLGGVPPLIVEPGRVRIDTLRIEGPKVFNGITGEPYGVLVGRMHVLLAAGPRGIRSNAFTVTVRP